MGNSNTVTSFARQTSTGTSTCKLRQRAPASSAIVNGAWCTTNDDTTHAPSCDDCAYGHKRSGLYDYCCTQREADNGNGDCGYRNPKDLRFVNAMLVTNKATCEDNEVKIAKNGSTNNNPKCMRVNSDICLKTFGLGMGFKTVSLPTMVPHNSATPPWGEVSCEFNTQDFLQTGNGKSAKTFQEKAVLWRNNCLNQDPLTTGAGSIMFTHCLQPGSDNKTRVFDESQCMTWWAQLTAMTDEKSNGVRDAFIQSYCKANPTHEACVCANRTSNTSYLDIKQNINNPTSASNDGCWFAPCANKNEYLITSDINTENCPDICVNAVNIKNANKVYIKNTKQNNKCGDTPPPKPPSGGGDTPPPKPPNAGTRFLKTLKTPAAYISIASATTIALIVTAVIYAKSYKTAAVTTTIASVTAALSICVVGVSVAGTYAVLHRQKKDA